MITPEKARAYIPILEALADGELQVKALDQWGDTDHIDPMLPPERYRRKPKVRRWSEWSNQYVARSCYFGKWLDSREAADCTASGERFAVFERIMEQEGDGPVVCLRCIVHQINEEDQP